MIKCQFDLILKMDMGNKGWELVDESSQGIVTKEKGQPNLQTWSTLIKYNKPWLATSSTKKLSQPKITMVNQIIKHGQP